MISVPANILSFAPINPSFFINLHVDKSNDFRLVHIDRENWNERRCLEMKETKLGTFSATSSLFFVAHLYSNQIKSPLDRLMNISYNKTNSY